MLWQLISLLAFTLWNVSYYQTHSQHSDYQCHTPSHWSTNYCWEVRVRHGLVLLCLTLWITEWRDSNGTGTVHSQSQPLDCNCHISVTPLFNVVHQLWTWGLCSSLQSGSECHFIRVWSNIYTIIPILEKHKYMTLYWLAKSVHLHGGHICMHVLQMVAWKTGRVTYLL